MNKKAMYKFSYGLFVLTTSYEGKDNGCTINTAIQVASDPNLISIALSKENYTHDMIMGAKRFNISVISQDVSFDIFKRFGFQSGRNVDKFEGFEECVRAENGIYYITIGTNAYFSIEVQQTLDLGSHTLFVGLPTAMEVLSDVPSATYDYYHSKIKPKPEAKKAKEGKTIWRCSICGYEYEGEILPEDFICPVCKHPASYFEKITS